MKAVAALDGKATIRQVKAYMRKHPHIADPSSMERSIHSLRIDKYCERIGQNQDGEDVYAAPTEPNPKGVRRDKRGFHAKMNLSKAEATCLGPVRAKAEDAKKDYDRLRAWRATMTLYPFRILFCSSSDGFFTEEVEQMPCYCF